jgi:hypothetical protein
MADPDTNGERELIHLPAPSVLPLFTAIGLAVGLVGLIISWIMVAVGGVIFLIAAVRWVRAVHEEIESLPAERH